MQTLEDDPLQKYDPLTELSPTALAKADGRGAPTQDEHEQEEKKREERDDYKLNQARIDIATAIMADPDNLELQRIQNDMQGANAKNTDPSKVQELSQRAKEEAGKAITDTVTSIPAALVGLEGLLASMNPMNPLAAMGVISDGVYYHPAQIGTGAPDFPPLVVNFAALPPPKPQAKQQGMEISLNTGG